MHALKTYEALAQAVVAWARDFHAPDYRRSRIQAWKSTAPNPAFKTLDWDARFILDRRFPLGDELEGWFIDLWTHDSRLKLLMHALQITICPVGLDQLPLPASRRALLDSADSSQAVSGAEKALGDSQTILFEALLRPRYGLYKGHPKEGEHIAELQRTILVTWRSGEDSVLAQILLLALRHGRAGQDAYDWLVDYCKRLIPEYAQPYAEDAVNRAIEQYRFPTAGPARYLRKIATTMGRNELFGLEIKAFKLGISVRTLHRWRAQDPDVDLGEKAHHRALKGYRGAAARELAERLGISIRAARMRIRRADQHGAPRPGD